MAITRLLTVRDVEESPPEGEWELIDGELVPVNPTSFNSSVVAMRIGTIVGAFVIEHDLGVVTGADGGFVIFPDRETLVAPDLGFVRKERIPPEDEQNRFARLAPDLVVEVLSPSDRMANALGKIGLYLEAGVQMVWLVDPVKRTISLFAEGDAPVRLGDDDFLTGGTVLPGFSVRVAELLG